MALVQRHRLLGSHEPPGDGPEDRLDAQENGLGARAPVDRVEKVIDVQTERLACEREQGGGRGTVGLSDVSEPVVALLQQQPTGRSFGDLHDVVEPAKVTDRLASSMDLVETPVREEVEPVAPRLCAGPGPIRGIDVEVEDPLQRPVRHCVAVTVVNQDVGSVPHPDGAARRAKVLRARDGRGKLRWSLEPSVSFEERGQPVDPWQHDDPRPQPSDLPARLAAREQHRGRRVEATRKDARVEAPSLPAGQESPAAVDRLRRGEGVPLDPRQLPRRPALEVEQRGLPADLVAQHDARPGIAGCEICRERHDVLPDRGSGCGLPSQEIGFGPFDLDLGGLPVAVALHRRDLEDPRDGEKSCLVPLVEPANLLLDPLRERGDLDGRHVDAEAPVAVEVVGERALERGEGLDEIPEQLVRRAQQLGRDDVRQLLVQSTPERQRHVSRGLEWQLARVEEQRQLGDASGGGLRRRHPERAARPLPEARRIPTPPVEHAGWKPRAAVEQPIPEARRWPVAEQARDEFPADQLLVDQVQRAVESHGFPGPCRPIVAKQPAARRAPLLSSAA